MIPNVVKGGDMPGLLRYLVGEGRANEHRDPQVISGDSHLVAWYGVENLDKGQANDIAAYLDRPRKVYGTELPVSVWTQDPATGARVPVLDEHGDQLVRDQHVWHCSLSLPPGEVLSAEQWDRVATEFADEMGLTAASGKAPARWVAIHHGESKNGNDHVHIAASMVREDGTRWEGRFRDYPRSQQVCRALELRHGLVQVDGRQHGTAMKGEKLVKGEPSTARAELGQRVRAAAVASRSEGEWIQRLRADGVVVKPRFAAGSTDVVAGYRVALKGTDKPAFYGGGQLGNDLTLPRIRENWPEPTVEAADQAAAEWQAAFRGQPPTTAGRETSTLGPKSPDAAVANLTKFADKLAGIPVTDRVAWNDAARDLSGALSAWARFDPVNAEQLRTAAATLALTAQQRRAGVQRPNSQPMGVATILLAARSHDKPKLQAAILIAQILKAAEAIRAYHQATGNLRQAQAVEQNVLQQLRTVKLTGYRPDYSHLSPEARQAREVADLMNGAPTGRQASPLPNPLDSRPQTGVRTPPGRGNDGYGR